MVDNKPWWIVNGYVDMRSAEDNLSLTNIRKRDLEIKFRSIYLEHIEMVVVLTLGYSKIYT